MAKHPGIHLALVAALILAGVPTAHACGSMGLDDPWNVAKLTLTVFGPMIALIPVELWLLRRLGGLIERGRMIKAYLACLLAKFAGVQVVVAGVGAELVRHIVVAELAYSAAHFAVSALILAKGFQLGGRPLWTCAAAISTLIPWTYSLALFLLNRG
jgi:hypothetical protein